VAKPRLGGTMFDSGKIRNDFPILKRIINGKPLVYLDNASTSQKPQVVIDTLTEYYQTTNANIHRGIYKMSEEATTAYEGVRSTVAEFIGAEEPENIIFTRNTTESINLIAYAWGRTNIKPEDEIVLTEMEHHSNIVPWQMLAEERNATIKYIPITEEGTLDLSNLDTLINENTKLVSFVHMSNVLGSINSTEEIVKRAHEVGAIVVLDAAQSVPHMPINVTALNCDFLAFSSHKMLGPTGIGVLYGKTETLQEMVPFMGGGEMIDEVYLQTSTYKNSPWRYEAGTPNIADTIAFGAAIQYLVGLGMDNVRAHEKELTAYALNSLKGIGAQVFGPTNIDQRGGVLSFWYQDIHPHDLATALDADGIAVRAGHHCAQPLMTVLKVPATTRASLYIYTTKEDIDILVASLMKAGAFFNHGT
jgi:cysteine desulfurase/selenocysteine lyase